MNSVSAGGLRFGQALTFFFRDERWFRKVLLPALCQFIPLIGLAAATGWALDICRRVIQKDEDSLPAMNFRRNLADGWKAWGVGLAYLLPAGVWLGVAGIASRLLFPSGAGVNQAAFDSFWWGSEFLAAALLLGAALGTTAAIGRMAETGSLRAAFRLRQIVQTVRSAPIEYLKVVSFWIPLGFLAVSGAAICGAGLFFTTAYALGSGFNLIGRAHLLAAEKAVSGSVSGRT
jgi:hypothetical protein